MGKTKKRRKQKPLPFKFERHGYFKVKYQAEEKGLKEMGEDITVRRIDQARENSQDSFFESEAVKKKVSTLDKYISRQKNNLPNKYFCPFKMVRGSATVHSSRINILKPVAAAIKLKKIEEVRKCTAVTARGIWRRILIRKKHDEIYIQKKEIDVGIEKLSVVFCQITKDSHRIKLDANGFAFEHTVKLGEKLIKKRTASTFKEEEGLFTLCSMKYKGKIFLMDAETDGFLKEGGRYEPVEMKVLKRPRKEECNRQKWITDNVGDKFSRNAFFQARSIGGVVLFGIPLGKDVDDEFILVSAKGSRNPRPSEDITKAFDELVGRIEQASEEKNGYIRKFKIKALFEPVLEEVEGEEERN